MKELLRFISRYSFLLFFIAFQFISLFLLFQYNDYQKASFINSANAVSGYFYAKASKVTDYINLKKVNHQLAAENSILHNQLVHAVQIPNSDIDSTYSGQYRVSLAKVINNSVNRQNNYITLQFGSNSGAMPENGVYCPSGLVGIIKNVSPNFSVVISLLNPDLRISAMIAKNGYYGSLVWDGIDYCYAMLKEIPNHVQVFPGDTIITSGYSAIFPKGILIGFVEEIMPASGENFYTLKIRFSTDFKNLQYVYVISNKLKDEQKKLEKQAGYGEGIH